jgi:hypothetical protein
MKTHFVLPLDILMLNIKLVVSFAHNDILTKFIE